MQPNRIAFFGIVGLAILIVAGMIIGTFFLFGSVGEVSPLQTEVDVEVVAAPVIYPWVEQAAQQFNQANPKTQVSVIEATELIPESKFRTAAAQPPPVAWIAEAGFVVELAKNKGLAFDDPQPVAGSDLAWGAYTDKLEQLTQSYGDLSWDSLHTKATSPDGLKLVISSPQNTAEGIAALISATAFAANAEAISSGDVSSANNWLTDTFGDHNATVPPTPAQSFASVQGRTLGDVGLLSMVSWRSAKLDQNPNFTLLPVEPAVTLDFPMAIWTGSRATPEMQAAAHAFRDFLLESSQQSQLTAYGLEPAAGQSGVQADGSTADRLQAWAARVLR
ncbi:MAG: substrate-binding domain-containing protein [Anaerolineae bacterium]|nr:substrate-binding domain-containing protein [Anaerolineae bacterium]